MNASIVAHKANSDAKIKEILRLLRQQQTSSSPILPSIETSTSAPSAPLPPPTSAWSAYKIMLRAEDVGYFDPDFSPSEQEHGITTPGPVVNAGKHAYHLDDWGSGNTLQEHSGGLRYSLVSYHQRSPF